MYFFNFYQSEITIICYMTLFIAVSIYWTVFDYFDSLGKLLAVCAALMPILSAIIPDVARLLTLQDSWHYKTPDVTRLLTLQDFWRYNTPDITRLLTLQDSWHYKTPDVTHVSECIAINQSENDLWCDTFIKFICHSSRSIITLIGLIWNLYMKQLCWEVSDISLPL